MFGFALTGKEVQPAEVLAGCKDNSEWIVNEGNYKYQLHSYDQQWK